ncbi:MAG: T9SS type A sorting domain-containing protein [Arcticibacter sp.]
MKRTYIFLFAIIIISCNAAGQGRNATWCFGDSAGVQFTSGGIVGITSVLQSQEASASISDTSGNLIFYTGSLGGNSSYYANIYNSLNQSLFNGDSIISQTSITQGLLILPKANNSSKYLLLSLGNIPNTITNVSLFLTEIDMSLNGGLGAAISKNQIIDSTFNYSEKMIAIKHGNGRDWWLLNHQNNTDLFITRLISNNSIAFTLYQHTGNIYSGVGWGQMIANPTGDKIVVSDYSGILEKYDFDRCTGLLTNYIDMSDVPLPGFDRYYGASISAQNILYYSTLDSLWQMNLNLINPVSSKTLVYSDINPNACMGQQLLGPDGKIYIANMLFCGGPTNVNDSLNIHLTVINQPDTPGIGCNVLPYNQIIGGGRTYLGLPNMPNYDLGPFAGSSCDTLTSVQSESLIKSRIDIVPNPVTDHFKISSSIKNNPDLFLEIKIFNSKGQLVFEDKIHKIGDEINFNKYDAGLYAITLSQKGRQWFCKFVKL